MSERVLFIDRDGTLIEEPADFQVDSVDEDVQPATLRALLGDIPEFTRPVPIQDRAVEVGLDAFPVFVGQGFGGRDDTGRCREGQVLSSQVFGQESPPSKIWDYLLRDKPGAVATAWNCCPGMWRDGQPGTR